MNLEGLHLVQIDFTIEEKVKAEEFVHITPKYAKTDLKNLFLKQSLKPMRSCIFSAMLQSATWYLWI